MKKVIKWVLIGVLVAVVLTVGISFAVWQYCYDGLRIGMTLEEYGEIEEAWSTQSLAQFFFREKENGDGLVVHFRFTGNWGEYVVDEMRFYPNFATGDPDEGFEKIEVGMSVYEVVELMGFPDSTDNAPFELGYEGEDGMRYIIRIGGEYNLGNWNFEVSGKWSE